jgi:hypothetical protein
MDLFSLTPTGKLNEVSITYNASRDVRLGPDNLAGALGDIIKCDTTWAQQRQKAGLTNLYGGEYMLVRTKSTSTAALLPGRPVFWSSVADLDACIVTPDAVATYFFAGIAINVPDTKGDCVLIVVGGDADIISATTADALGVAMGLLIGGGVATATSAAGSFASGVGALNMAANVATAASRMHVRGNLRRYKEGVR